MNLAFKVLIWGVRIFVLAGLAYYVFGLASWENLKQIKTTTIIKALTFPAPIFCIAIILSAWRFKIVSSDASVSLRMSLEAQLYSAAMNLIVPARAAEILKATFLKGNYHTPLEVGFAATVTERIYDFVFMLGLLAALVVSYLMPVYMALGVGLMVVALLPMWMPNGIVLFRFMIRWTPASFLNEVTSFLMRVQSEFGWSRSLVPTGLTIVSMGLYFLACFISFASILQVDLSLGQLLLIYCIFLLAISVPIMPAGIGVVQIGLTTTMVEMGVGVESAIVASICVHLASVLIAIVCFPYLSLTRKSGLLDLAGEARKMWER